MTTEPTAAPTKENGENRKKMQPGERPIREKENKIPTTRKTHKQGRRERRSSRKATIKTTIMNNEQEIRETPNKQQLKQQNNKKQCKTKMTKMGKLKNS